MVEGLLVDGHIFSSVRVNAKCFHVVSIDKTIDFIGCVVAAVILKALSVEILSESCIG